MRHSDIGICVIGALGKTEKSEISAMGSENDVMEGMKKTGAVKEFIRLLKASAGN